MAVHGPLNAFSFDISLVKIGQEIKLLEHLKKNWITLYKCSSFTDISKGDWITNVFDHAIFLVNLF
jgi:hypothetical protein